MIKLLVTELETERLRLSFSRLPVFPALWVRLGRVQEPKRQVALRPVGLCICRLGLPEDRQDHPERMEWTLLLEIALRPVGLCVYRFGLPVRRQVGLGFDSGLPAQIRLSFCPLEAASRAELLWLLH